MTEVEQLEAEFRFRRYLALARAIHERPVLPGSDQEV
jgi:hypothetical protein